MNFFTKSISPLQRVFAAVAIFSLVFALFANQALAAANYAISGSLTQDGLEVDASGSASANTYTGQGTAQFISINWDFEGDNDAWVTLKDHNSLNFLDGDKGSNKVITSTAWNASHTYPAPGTYTVKALIHHQSPNGNESGSQVFTQIVTVSYACSDSVDNDDDDLTDFPNDPGCSSATDTDEFNEPVPNNLPVINLNGLATINLTVGDVYTELATASDVEDGNLTTEMVIGGGPVSTVAPATFNLTYNVTDTDGGDAIEVTRTVNVSAAPVNNLPVIELNGSSTINITVGGSYSELGATADDIEDGLDIVVTNITGAVDASTIGVYLVNYNFTDTDGGVATQVTRTVNVVAADNENPDPEVLSCAINSDQNPVEENEDFVITWSSNLAVSATLNGDSVATTGTLAVDGITEDTTYTLIVEAASDARQECSVLVEVDEDNGGGGSGRRSGSRNNNDDDEDEPTPEVLGESTSVLPIGAPNTGAGGAATSPIASLISIFGMLMSLVAVRFTKNV